MDVVIEFKDKKYQQTSKDWTLANWIADAGESQCPRDSIKRFGLSYSVREWIYNPYMKILPEKGVIKWLTMESSEHIPWLVENGYLEEVEEEAAYPVGQWFKSRGCYYRLSRMGHNMAAIICIDTQSNQYYGAPFEVKDFKAVTLTEIHKGANSFDPAKDETPIPPPHIVEQRGRIAEGCISGPYCKNPKAQKHFAGQSGILDGREFPCDGTIKCFETCPEYNGGK